MSEPTYSAPSAGHVLDQLIAGRISTEDAAAAFSDMDWPPPAPRARTLADVESDPDPRAAQPGDFAMVSQAYTDGKITLGQYEALANAVAGSAAPATQDAP